MTKIKERFTLRKLLNILVQATILYAIYFIGVFIERTFHLPVPGSVIGMILLFILLLSNIVRPAWIENGAGFFTSHLTLFFIPATVGIVNYLNLFTGKGFLLILITILSTAFVMLSSSMVSQWLIGRKEKKYD